jgi:hypothetical protein
LLGAMIAAGFADRVGLVADRLARALGGPGSVRERSRVVASAGFSAGSTLGAPAGMIVGAIVGYQVEIPLGKDPAALGLIVGFWVGMLCLPVVAALAGAMVGALVGGLAGGIAAVGRAVGRAAAYGRRGAIAAAGSVVAMLALVLAAVLALTAGMDAAFGAGAGGLAGSLLGAAVGAFARGRQRWIALWAPTSHKDASLWLFWPGSNGLVGVCDPALRLREGALHAEDGPAVSWPWGARAWFWRGVRVPGRVVERPEALSAEEIRAERDPDVRQVMIERFGGVDPYMHELGARLAQQDDYGRLWRGKILPADDEPVATAVEVRDATSGSVSLLRVPPSTRTAREAVAWTFGFDDPLEYHPEVET